MTAEPRPPRWAHIAGTFRGFEHRFTLGATDEVVARHLADLWWACADGELWGRPPEGDEQPTYGLEAVPAEDDRPAVHRLWAHGAISVEHDDPSLALRDLVRHVNRDAVANAGDLVVFHAAGAALDGKGVLIPGPSGSGKTTLVAQLMLDGWTYLGDEAIGIHPETLEMHAYPKPLSVEPGSWAVLDTLRPVTGRTASALHSVQWQLPPSKTPSATAGPIPCDRVVHPSRGDVPAQTDLTRTQLTRGLAESCFTLRTAPGLSLEVAAAVARRPSGRRPAG